MATTLHLPEKTRARLAALYLAKQRADEAFQGPMVAVIEVLGLDPSLNHHIDFDTGIITPAEPFPTPELVKPDEEAASAS